MTNRLKYKLVLKMLWTFIVVFISFLSLKVSNCFFADAYWGTQQFNKQIKLANYLNDLIAKSMQVFQWNNWLNQINSAQCCVDRSTWFVYFKFCFFYAFVNFHLHFLYFYHQFLNKSLVSWIFLYNSISLRTFDKHYLIFIM